VSIFQSEVIAKAYGQYSTECNTGIIAACLPCLKPLFKQILEKSSWAYGSSRSNNKTNNYSLHNFASHQVRGSKYQNSVTVSHITSKSAKVQIEGIGDNISEESILPLQSNTITKTTVVMVDRSSSDGNSERAPWPKKLDISPERKIEDRV
jgi:ribosomal protein S8E